MSVRRWLSGAVVTLVGAGLLLLAAAGPAAAHARLDDVTPAPGSVVQTAPQSLRLAFSEPVQVTPGSISITGPDGEPLDGLRAGTEPTDGSVLVVDLPDDLPNGTYQVAWRVASLDTHPVQGTFGFAIGSPSSPLPRSGSTASVGPTLVGGAGRAAAAAGALSVAGLAAFPLLVLIPARRRLRDRDRGAWAALSAETSRRLRVPLVLAGAVTVAGTCAVLLDIALGTDRSVLETATGTRAGQILLTRIVAVLLVIGVATVRVQTVPTVRRLTLCLIGSGAALATLSLSGHAAAAVTDRPVAVSFDLAHLIAAGVWAGGLLGLAIAALPAAAFVAGEDRERLGDSASALVASFSVVAQLAMLGVLVTGLYATLLQVSSLRDLGETAWGIALVAKLGLWASALLFAAMNAFTFVPALAGRAGTIARRLAAGGQLRLAIRVEIGLAAALIAVAALMSATEQPEQQLAAESQQAALNNVETTSARAASGGYVARVRTTRTGVGDTASTRFDVALRTGGTPITIPGARSVLTSDGGSRRTLSLQFEDVGRWASRLVSIAPGRYHLTTRFGRRERTLTFPAEVTVPAAPRDVVAAARGNNTETDARARARTALLATLCATGLLAAIATLALGLKRSRRRTRVSVRTQQLSAGG
jgi:copper transport protein